MKGNKKYKVKLSLLAWRSYEVSWISVSWFKSY